MRRHLWWILGLLLLGGGLAIALSLRAGPSDFGHTYTSLSPNGDWYMGWSDGTDVSSFVVSRWQIAGSAVAAIGMAVIASDIGFHLGRRRANHREPVVAAPVS